MLLEDYFLPKYVQKYNILLSSCIVSLCLYFLYKARHTVIPATATLLRHSLGKSASGGSWQSSDIGWGKDRVFFLVGGPGGCRE
jgi:hypothetical protein